MRNWCGVLLGGLLGLFLVLQEPIRGVTSAFAQPASPAVPPAELGLDGVEQQYVALYERVSPSVVHIHTDRRQPGATSGFGQPTRVRRFGGFQGRISDPNGGSGFVFDADGLILTTNRVIDGAKEIEITFADGSKTAAMVIGADRNTDLAVLKVSERPAIAKPLSLGDSDSLRIGQRVLALGDALGHGAAMTVGVVSAKARNIQLEIRAGDGFFTAPDLIQTDALIIPGAVGGPLINLRGKVIGVLGVDTLVFDAAGDFPVGGVGFSIPTSSVKRVVPALLTQGRYAYPWLGISGMDLEPDLTQAMGLAFDQRGVMVVQVTADGPAFKAGVREGTQPAPQPGANILIGGDVIIAFESEPVTNFNDLVSLLFRLGDVGQTVTLTVIRDGEEADVPILLEERP